MKEHIESRTLLAIHDAAKAANWTRTQVSELTEAMFAKKPEDLTEREGQALLQQFTKSINVDDYTANAGWLKKPKH